MSVDQETDVCYYNTVITNPSTSPIPATYNTNLSIPILNTPNEWYASIIRFSIPTNNLPLMICPIVPNQGNPNLTTLIFGIFYGGNYFFRSVIWDSNVGGLTPPTQNLPKQIITPYYYIYTYDHFIYLINSCLSLVYADAVAAGLPNVAAPQFIFDSDTQLIKLVVPSQFTDYGGVGVPILYCNQTVTTYFTTFDFHIQQSTISNRYADFNLYKKPFNSNGYTITGTAATNPSTYFYFSQEADLKVLWAALKKIVIKSAIGATQEIIPSFSPTTGTLTDGFNIEQALQDFIPNLDFAYQARLVLNYNPTAQYRLVNLNSHDPLRNLNLQIFWTDVQNNIYPLFLSPNQTIEIKIAFFKKDKYSCIKR